MYLEEKQSITQTENGAYIKVENLGIPNDNQVSTTCPHSIGKGRLDKISIDKGRIEQATQVSLYGEYKNIRLTDEEYQNLQDKLQGYTSMMIEKLSRYIKSTGKTYQDHYVTILNWYEQDKEKLSQKKDSKTYSTDYEDSDTL